MSAPSCPHCNSFNVDAEFVDVGVGGSGMQVTPYTCGDCEAQQMNPHHDNSRATEEEKQVGWWRGPPAPVAPYQVEPEDVERIKRGMLAGKPTLRPRGNV